LHGKVRIILLEMKEMGNKYTEESGGQLLQELKMQEFLKS